MACSVLGPGARPYSVPLWDNTDARFCRPSVETSFINSIGTETGAVICHNCLPLIFDGAKISETLEDGWIEIFAGSNARGGSYGRCDCVETRSRSGLRFFEFPGEAVSLLSDSLSVPLSLPFPVLPEELSLVLSPLLVPSVLFFADFRAIGSGFFGHLISLVVFGLLLLPC